MDEPTSAIDPVVMLKIEETVAKLKERFTVVIVTHSMQQAARLLDYTAFFYQGGVVECETERKSKTLATEVLDGDDEIDEKEARIEEECLKVLALHQPVAGDLRHVVTLLKVNTELERIGDLAVSIAERVFYMLLLHSDMKLLDVTDMFMASNTQIML